MQSVASSNPTLGMTRMHMHAGGALVARVCDLAADAVPEQSRY